MSGYVRYLLHDILSVSLGCDPTVADEDVSASFREAFLDLCLGGARSPREDCDWITIDGSAPQTTSRTAKVNPAYPRESMAVEHNEGATDGAPARMVLRLVPTQSVFRFSPSGRDDQSRQKTRSYADSLRFSRNARQS